MHRVLAKCYIAFFVSDLNTGQTVIVSILTEEELKEDYGSDASEEFVPYISNPNVSMHSTERLLSGR